VTDAARHQRVNALFEAALALEPPERNGFLLQACKADAALQAEVESLLTAHAHAGDFLLQPVAHVRNGSPIPSLGNVAVDRAPVLAMGDRVGPYEIIGDLGAGGMGEVYKAHDTRLGRTVALKVLAPSLANDPRFRARFDREARAIAALAHPNICTLHDIGHLDAAPGHAGEAQTMALDYLVMEHLEGQTLAAVLDRGRLPARRALRYASQIAEALDAAHVKGIIHRDLKPANVVITTADAIKILDFGLARIAAPAIGRPNSSSELLAGEESIAATAEGIILGTAAYMSPEQARGQAVDKRTDVWAFGCVLYEMLAGRAAFMCATVSDTIANILKGEPDWQHVGATPTSIRRLLQRCLEKEPRRRLHDIADARIEIDDALTAPLHEASATPPRKLARSAVGLSAALIVALFAVAVAWRAFAPVTRELPPRISRSSLLMPADVTFDGMPPALRLALSPDGTRLAFSAFGPDGLARLYVRSLNSLTAQPLVGTEGAVAPFWSPNGRFIAYFAGANPNKATGATNGSVKKISVDGGPAVTLCDFPATATGASWSRDDIILFTTGNGPGGGSVRRVSGMGGNSEVVLTPDLGNGEAEYWWPFFLPDGRHFTYFALGPELEPIGIYVASLASSERKLLVRGGSNAKYANGYLAFVREQTLMAQQFDVERLELVGNPVPVAEEVAVGGGAGATGAFTVSETGVLAYVTGIGSQTRLTWLNAVGEPLGPVGGEAQYDDLELSPDGSRASVSLPDPTQRTRDIWLVDLAKGTRTRFTFDAADERASVWSPEGTRLVFNSRRSRAFDLYQKASNGIGGEELLLADEADKIPLSWSLDGQFLLYMRNSAGSSWDLWVLPLSREGRPFPFAQTRFAEGPGEFSPDGRWITYASNESGEFELYVAPFPGTGGKVPVTLSHFTFQFLLRPRWRGEQIFYPGGPGITAASVRPKGDVMEVVDARGVLLRSTFTIPRRLRNFYDVSRDGKRILFNSVVEQPGLPSPITLVVNWTADLER
jgi:serine/threonine protein kinase/Tol biopolymer transport system component